MGDKSVWINGNEYKISGRVLKTALPAWPETIRLTTEEQRESLQGVGKWVIKFDGGFGRYSLPQKDPYNKDGRWWDSEWETRWAEEDMATLPAAVNIPLVASTANGASTTGVVPTDGNTDVYFLDQKDFNGKLYALAQQSGGTTKATVFQWSGSATNWLKASDVGVAGTATITASRGYLSAIGNTFYAWLLNERAAGSTGVHLYSSTDAAIWTRKDTTGLVAYGASDQAGPIIQSGRQIIFTYWDNSAGLVYCYYSDDGGANVTEMAAIPSSGIPVGLTLWRDEDGKAVPWIRLKENAGYVTTGGYVPVVDTPGTQSNDFGIETWNGDLYLPIGQGLEHCWYDNGVFNRQDIGLNKDSGIPSPKYPNHTINAMTKSARWLFVSYGSTSTSMKSYIYALDGKRWHFISRGTGVATKLIRNIWISYNDDGTDRLHMVVEDTATRTREKYCNAILDSPRGGGWTYDNSAASYFNTPRFDAGMGEINGVLLEAHFMAGTSLSSSTAANSTYVSCQYGVNGALAGTVLGNFTSGTTKLSFGSNSAGIAFKDVALYFRAFANSDGSTTPECYGAVLYFKKKPPRRYQWRFTIDLTGQPVWNSERVDSVTQLAQLETDIDTVTLLTFRYGEIQTDKYVEITEMLQDTEWVEQRDRILPQGREGRVAVTVETPL